MGELVEIDRWLSFLTDGKIDAGRVIVGSALDQKPLLAHLVWGQAFEVALPTANCQGAEAVSHENGVLKGFIFSKLHPGN